MAEDAFVTDFEHIMADDITDDVRFIMYDSESGKTASAGEVSKYMMRNVHVDTTLTEEGSAAEAKAVGEALANKADTKGRYEDLTVGGAEQLMADGHESDSEPYLFRPTGGSADVGNREYLDKIVGGTVAWNQKFQSPNFSDSSKWRIYTPSKGTFSVASNVATIEYNETATGGYPYGLVPNYTIPIETGHKYILAVDVKSDFTADMKIELGTETGSGKTLTVNSWNSLTWLEQRPYWISHNGVIIKPVNASIVSGSKLQFRNASLFDLTQLFGSTIADYIYSLEQAHAGAGVAWFRNYFPKDYYPYDPGTLRSVEGVSAHETVGFNQWDEEWELGRYDTNGTKTNTSDAVRAKNYIPCFPNTVYYFRNGTNNGGRICWYDADKQFISTETGFNTTKTSPSGAHFLTISTSTEYGTTYNNDICINLSDPTRNGEYEPYTKHAYPLDSSLTLRGVPKLVDGKLAFDGDIYPPSGEVQRRYGLRAYQSGDESLADAITDGTNTVYKLATPTTETAEGYEQYQICDTSGTEEFVTDSIVPVGHETRYPHDLKKKIETAPDSPSADGTYLMKRSGGKNSYMALPSTPSANGSYVLTVTVSGGSTSYSWTAKE